MDRWRWLQRERAERPPNHRLPKRSFLWARRIRSARELVFRRPRLLVARGPIWFGVPYRDALKFTFAQLPGNNGVDVGVVHNDESRSAPADRTSWQELQHSCHGRFFAPDGGKTL